MALLRHHFSCVFFFHEAFAKGPKRVTFPETKKRSKEEESKKKKKIGAALRDWQNCVREEGVNHFGEGLDQRDANSPN